MARKLIMINPKDATGFTAEIKEDENIRIKEAVKTPMIAPKTIRKAQSQNLI